ncbi:MAG TPA: cation-translocating P-type ATPase C-terminal domain-containing protein [candidate division Zixibacteria bacterium]|nr:cation-translocating P-type ATPase C-terminal domain-containing protein [candidate division Zixibacteria bacterium]
MGSTSRWDPSAYGRPSSPRRPPISPTGAGPPVTDASRTQGRGRAAGWNGPIGPARGRSHPAGWSRAFHRPFTNSRLWGAIGLSLVLQLLVIRLPLLNTAFGTVPLSPGEWALAVGLASAVLWAEELRKLVGRRVGVRLHGAVGSRQ